MTTPIPNCPQPETPIRDRAWTDEQRLVEARVTLKVISTWARCGVLDRVDVATLCDKTLATIEATP